MKLGAFHIYIVIISIFSMVISLIKLFEGAGDSWIILLFCGCVVLCVYVAMGVEYIWGLENG
jgi:uncharacterized membrane protein